MVRKLFYLFNLHRGENDKATTLEAIKGNISFSGANLWILACAILIASVGLNVNSTAVIIGAMLISPLMGPIVASGFALGVYDFELLKRALKNLAIATVASLLVSTLYFYLSPFKTAQNEILARTSPNIYDILIAFFGGLAGVIAVTRTEKGNPIPGVAIATALMPPLCTAGYGLATGEFRYFFGAMFLYMINCVFICISTFAIVKYMKYPATKQVDAKHQWQVRYGITILVFALVIPSVFFAYRLYARQKFKETVNIFINRELVGKGENVLFNKANYYSTPKTISIALLNHRLDSLQIDQLNKKLPEYSLFNTRIEIIQENNDDLNALKKSILNEIKEQNGYLTTEDARVRLLEAEISKSQYDNRQISQEVKALFPLIDNISLADHKVFSGKDTSFTLPYAIYDSNDEIATADRNKLKNWLIQRLRLDTVIILKN